MIAGVVLACLSAASLLDGPAVAGRVVADESGEPIVNARVRIAAAGAQVPIAVTDSTGGFAASPPAGALTISASKSGYTAGRVTVTDRSRPIEIRLQRTAVISGRVADRIGEPVVATVIIAEAAPSASPSRAVARTETDDRGEFRLAGLPAGQFIVSATTVGATAAAATTNGRTVYSTEPKRTYFPAASTASDAEVISLRPGDEQSAVDFIVASDQTGAGTGFVMFVGPVSQSAGPMAGVNSAIGGRVTAEGRPLSGATVQLYGRGTPVPLRSIRSDGEGRFEFDRVPAGTFRVAASKPGYGPVKMADALFPNFPRMGAGPSIELQDDEMREDADVELARLGTVSGVVSDELGEPLQGATVQLMQIRYERGRRRLAAATGLRFTDDLGIYRIFGVPPGQYIVTASIGGVTGADLPGYARSYFPGSDDPRAAQFLSIDTSQDVAGIDFSLQPVRTARISGKIFGASGEPTSAGTVQLRPDTGGGEIAALPTGAKTERDGAFEFPNVPPGRYLIYVDHGRSNPSIEGDFAVLPVAVNETDVDGVTIQVSPGSTIAGRITFDSADRTNVPPFSRVEIGPVAVDPDLAPANVADAGVRDDGSFRMEGVRGLRRIEATHVPPGWTLREVRVNGLDATDRPLTFGRREQSLSDVEVILTDRATRLAGSVAGDREQPVAGAHVIVFSTDRERRYPASRFVREAATAAEGTFDVSGLPPGSYYVAVAGRPPLDGADAWQDPAFLEALVPDAVTVMLGEGATQTVKIRTAAR